MTGGYYVLPMVQLPKTGNLDLYIGIGIKNTTNIRRFNNSGIWLRTRSATYQERGKPTSTALVSMTLSSQSSMMTPGICQNMNVVAPGGNAVSLHRTLMNTAASTVQKTRFLSSHQISMAIDHNRDFSCFLA